MVALRVTGVESFQDVPSSTSVSCFDVVQLVWCPLLTDVPCAWLVDVSAALRLGWEVYLSYTTILMCGEEACLNVKYPPTLTKTFLFHVDE